MQETNSVHVQRVLLISQMLHQLISHYENVPGKHHYLVVKDIEDVIVKHRAEVTFARAESQTSYATLNVTIVYRAKINDICFDIIMFYISFVLFFFSFYY